jgi:hypothetical protein
MKKELSLLQQEEKKLKGKSISAIITFYLWTLEIACDMRIDQWANCT